MSSVVRGAVSALLPVLLLAIGACGDPLLTASNGKDMAVAGSDTEEVADTATVDAAEPDDTPTADDAPLSDAAAPVDTHTEIAEIEIDASPPPELSVPWFFSIHAVEVGYDLVKAAQAFDLVKDLGGSGVRTDLYWRDVEPTDGGWDDAMLTFYVDYVALAKAHGLEPMVIVSGPANWAIQLYTSNPDAFWNRYEAYVRGVLTPIAADIAHVQLWNEANHFIDPIGAADDWQLFARAGAIVRELASNAKTYVNVMANTLGWEDAVTDWVTAASDAIDVIGVDHYPGTWSPVAFDDWQPLEILIAHLNAPNDPWFGKEGAVLETGYSSWAAILADEASQKAWVEQSLPAMQLLIEAQNASGGARIGLVNYYQLVDVDTGGVGQEAHFGIVHTDYTPKQGYEALKAAIAAY